MKSVIVLTGYTEKKQCGLEIFNFEKEHLHQEILSENGQIPNLQQVLQIKESIYFIKLTGECDK